MRFAVGVLLLSLALPARELGAQEKVYRLDSTIQHPGLLRQVTPPYTPQAKTAAIQGNVIFEVVIGSDGKPRDIQLLSGLGYGLDENAERAIEDWRFRPATRQGRPVAVTATIEVNFRLDGLDFDAAAEARRSKLNVATAALRSEDPGRAGKSVAAITELAKENYAPAQYILGRLHLRGELVAKDPRKAMELLLAAARSNHGPAKYEIGLRMMEGYDGFARDFDGGFRMMKEAAVSGSDQAQYLLGAMYQSGTGVDADPAQASRYYRQCAAIGSAPCQLRLARLLLALAPNEERTRIQAAAWVQLAADGGEAEAKKLLGSEQMKLSVEESESAKKLKARLLRVP